MRAVRTPAGSPLERLARARGVSTAYEDAFEQRRQVPVEAVIGVLQALGEELDSPAGAAACLARLEAGRRAAGRHEPVVVAWDGSLPEGSPTGDGARLELEDGTDASRLLGTGPGAGARHRLPFGTHRLFPADDPDSPVLVLSAPRSARPLEPSCWGVFAPTYGLFDGRETPAGDLSALERLGLLAGRLGASYVATLPLLADFSATDTPSAARSPYSPLTRMWWNEAYLDLERLPELEGEVRVPVREGAPPRLADVAAAGSFVRPLLGVAAERLVAAGGPRLASFRAFQAERPDVLTYATYRAAAEVAGPAVSAWPRSWVAGNILAGRDVPHEAVLAHVYAQWAVDDQLGDVARRIAAAGCRLMADLPVGSRADGYDPWAYPGSFAGSSGSRRRATVGAPPDQFFSGGQNWGFRPLHPDGERASGYPVVRTALAHLLRHCGALRIDHVMGLQRLWWIPEGAPADLGAYVHYRSEELLAIACLEAWRRGASLVGEDLGTVDPALRELLACHGIAGMHVAVLDLEVLPGKPLSPRPGSVAFVDTHDTATFAGWFDGTDIEDRVQLGIIDEEEAETERSRRNGARDWLLGHLTAAGALEDPGAGPDKVHAALLEELGTSEAAMVVANLEDLWGEHDPQNIPGTTNEHPNFSRRLSVSLAQLESSMACLEPLRRLDGARRRRARRPS